MRGPREILNGLKWTTGLDGVEVWFVHRGAPGDGKVVAASEIRVFASWYFTLDAPPGRSGTIPYHRVTRITRRAEVVWARHPGDSASPRTP